jgi:hypothetical chaperone protein
VNSLSRKNFCGLDFGTSNSSIGFITDDEPMLAQFEGREYIPSAIFFDHDSPEPLFGNLAIEKYIDGCEGRMIWSPKNALGSALILEKTQIKDTFMSFKDIIALIVKNLKNHCETQAQAEMNNVVVGRPVFFNDNDTYLDNLAQNAVREILNDVGFNNIEFEFEPIAAAIHYEQSINKEELALVVDMGGGTSDFTVAKLEPATKMAGKDRKSNILSVGGIHVAGTDFDRQLSLKTLMPELGLGALYKSLEGSWLPVPAGIFRDLATWHKIGFLYNNKNISYIKSKIFTSDCPAKFERMLETLEKRRGHYLARLVEKAKINLSDSETSLLTTQEIRPEIVREITKAEFELSIEELIQQIAKIISVTIEDAGVSPGDIDAIFMTGGSSLIPAVRKSIFSLMPNARLIEGDKFGSVAMGLTISAREKFA